MPADEQALLEALQQARLGETSEEYALGTREENRIASGIMAAQATRSICIASRDLDHYLYDTSEFAEAIKNLATSNRNARVQILVWETDKIIKQGHRLIEIMRRLTSFIDMKIPARQHREYNEALLLVDDCGYIHRDLSDRYEAKACFNSPRTTNNYYNQFKEMWDHGDYDPNLRRLHL